MIGSLTSNPSLRFPYFIRRDYENIMYNILHTFYCECISGWEHGEDWVLEAVDMTKTGHFIGFILLLFCLLIDVELYISFSNALFFRFFHWFLLVLFLWKLSKVNYVLNHFNLKLSFPVTTLKFEIWLQLDLVLGSIWFSAIDNLLLCLNQKIVFAYRFKMFCTKVGI